MTEAKPIVKWAGGKSYLVPLILERLPAKVNKFYEPFAGGAAVSIAMMNAGRCSRVYLSDANDDLIGVYRTVMQNPEALITSLARLKAAHDENPPATYENERATEYRPGTIEAAARFIYLNKTCYNGLYRVNKSGHFNVPMGKYTNPNICDAENIRALSRLLRKHHAVIRCGDFGRSTPWVTSRDAVYYDPPYVPLVTESFTSYTLEGFSKFDHGRLARVFRYNTRQGAACLLSNSDTAATRAFYPGHKIELVDVPRRINSKGSKRGCVSEILVTGVRS